MYEASEMLGIGLGAVGIVTIHLIAKNNIQALVLVSIALSIVLALLFLQTRR